MSVATVAGRETAVGADRRWYSVEEFWREARRQGAPISRGVAYEGVRTGRIPSVRLGRRIAIPADALDRLLADRGAPDSTALPAA